MSHQQRTRQIGDPATRLSLIVARALLVLLEREVPGPLDRALRALEQKGALQRFPDGSLQIEGDGAYEFYERVYLQHPNAAEQRGGASDMWRALAAFTPRSYELDFPSDYYESLMPDGFIGGYRHVNPPLPGESNLANLAVTVAFKRRLSNKTMQLYAKMVGEWLGSVVQQGIFGEGPIAPIAPVEVVFQNPRAQFRIDARHSGQNSLNWFVLNALHFGIEVSGIHTVLFDGEEELELRLPPASGKITRLPVEVRAPGRPVGQATTGASGEPPREDTDAVRLKLVGAEDAEDQARWPSDCVAYTDFASELSLLTRPYFEWDAFAATLNFGRAVTSAEENGLRELLEAWAMIGSYGGLGGEGIHSFHGVTFDRESESALFSADMGDADEQTAIPMLLRVLEGFARAVPIEAVVFGRVSIRERRSAVCGDTAREKEGRSKKEARFSPAAVSTSARGRPRRRPQTRPCTAAPRRP